MYKHYTAVYRLTHLRQKGYMAVYRINMPVYRPYTAMYRPYMAVYRMTPKNCFLCRISLASKVDQLSFFLHETCTISSQLLPKLNYNLKIKY